MFSQSRRTSRRSWSGTQQHGLGCVGRRPKSVGCRRQQHLRNCARTGPPGGLLLFWSGRRDDDDDRSIRIKLLINLIMSSFSRQPSSIQSLNVDGGLNTRLKERKKIGGRAGIFPLLKGDYASGFIMADVQSLDAGVAGICLGKAIFCSLGELRKNKREGEVCSPYAQCEKEKELIRLSCCFWRHFRNFPLFYFSEVAALQSSSQGTRPVQCLNNHPSIHVTYTEVSTSHFETECIGFRPRVGAGHLLDSISGQIGHFHSLQLQECQN